MPLDEERVAGLSDLLRECCAQVTDAGGTRGTGFFVDEQLLLTCAHVVPGAGNVMVEPFGRPSRAGRVVAHCPGNAEDLALVEVEPVDEAIQPTVVLDGAIRDGVQYVAVGYPSDSMGGDSGQEAVRFAGHARVASDGRRVQRLDIEAGGPRVVGGISGGPVLSPESGAVVAVMQYSEDTSSDSGGGAIPIARAAELLDPVKRLLSDRDVPAGARPWRDALGEAAWQALGKRWSMRRTVNVVVRGSRRGWQVTIDPDDAPPYEVTVRDLPDDLAEAVFEWIQRGRVRSSEQVLSLGRLLSGAVFPPPVMSRIVRSRTADDLLVCLEVDRESDLFDVPWEFVTVEADGGHQHIAAEAGVELVRVAAPSRPPAPNGGRAGAGLLGVVMQPPEWQDEMPKVRRESVVEWPEAGAISRHLLRAVAQTSLEPSIVEVPKLADIEQALANGKTGGEPFDVLHYIGFGRATATGGDIAVSDGYDVQWRDITELFDLAAGNGVRLLIVEFLLPRLGSEEDPIHPRAFVDALRGDVDNVLFTTAPLHPRQLFAFNETFYKRIGAEKTVGAAVQNARRVLRVDKPMSDPTGFGWFTLLTGPEPGLHFAAAPVQDAAVAQPSSRFGRDRGGTLAPSERHTDAVSRG